MLRSRVTEWVTIGAVELLIGILAGLATGSAWWLATAACFGFWMYTLSYRHEGFTAVTARQRPQGEVESVTRTRASAAVIGLLTCAALALVSMLWGVEILASIATGNGAALLVASAKLRRWERTHGGHVVTTSRWRWWTSIDVYVLR